MKDKKQFLECGAVINTHGVRGDVKSECWCDYLEVMTEDLSVLYLKKGAEYWGDILTEILKEYLVCG